MSGPGACVWITGPRRSGVSTIARIVVTELLATGRPAVLLDEAEVREHLAAGELPARRALRWLVGLLAANGVTAVVAVPSSSDDRDGMRELVADFVEVFVDTPPDVCAMRGAPSDAAYDEPLAPELRVLTHDRAADASAAQVVSYLETRQA